MANFNSNFSDENTSSISTEEDKDENFADFTGLLLKIDSVIEKLPINEENKQSMTKSLRDFIKITVKSRSPRIVLFGQSGSAKSSIVNAILNQLNAARVGHTKPETCEPKWHSFSNEYGELYILDTAGLFDQNQPEKKIIKGIEKALDEHPADLILYVEQWTLSRSNNIQALKALEKLAKVIARSNKQLKTIPVIAVMSKSDQASPEMELLPTDYTAKKFQKIKCLHEKMSMQQDTVDRALIEHIQNECKKYDPNRVNLKTKLNEIHKAKVLFEDRVAKHIDHTKKNVLKKKIIYELKATIPVSTLMTFEDTDEGQVLNDMRWQVDELVQAVYKVVPKSVQLQLVRVSQLKNIQGMMSRVLILLITTICTVVGAADPIPISDIMIISPLQALMVIYIAFVSGRKITLTSVSELFSSLGITVAIGFSLRAFTSSLLKLLPGIGQVVSGITAFVGTWALGEAAIAYFINRSSSTDVKAVYNSIKDRVSKFIRKRDITVENAVQLVSSFGEEEGGENGNCKLNV